MEPKKTKKADLERNRGAFVQIGLVASLSIVLIAFDFSSKEVSDEFSYNVNTENFIQEEIPYTRRPEVKPEPIRQLQIAQILEIVDNGEDIPIDINFNPEAGGETRYNPAVYNNIPEKFKDEDFIVVEEMPKFNGGDPKIEFRKFIVKNLQYPEIAAINGVSGKVQVQFIIDKKGNLINAEVINAVDPALDKEALRVINSSPVWEPGKQRGKPARVIFTFPIGFVLENK